MDTSMKKWTALILICFSIVVICACGRDESMQEKGNGEEIIKSDETLENSKAGPAKEEREDGKKSGMEQNEDDGTKNDRGKDGMISHMSGREAWEEAYLSYLDRFESADTCTYSLIYVDEDDIPELVIDSGFEASGCIVLTFHEGLLDEWQSSRLHFTYIEHGNLICNSEGHMGYYYDYVYTIQDGKWCYVDGGVYGDGLDGPQLDENGDYIFEYEWSGEKVSEEEYETRLNEVYPTDRQMHPKKYYIPNEIRSVLSTGDVTSAGHRYELVVEDLTWKEAEDLCREKGGYLATVTSWEEMDRIQEQIISEEKTNITFFVGANNERKEGIYHGYHWIEPEKGATCYYNMLNFYNALFCFWLDGEPSYTGLTEEGVEVDEDYVVMFYRKSEERCYLNDVPDDILSAAPSYRGRVGYICEYEE